MEVAFSVKYVECLNKFMAPLPCFHVSTVNSIFTIRLKDLGSEADIVVRAKANVCGRIGTV